MAKNKKSENVFHLLARWFTRWFMGGKYEEKWFLNKNGDKKEDENTNKPDDSDLIVSPARQVFQRFISRKFAVFSVFVVIIMFGVVFIGPNFLHKYYDAYTETTLQNLPPSMSLLSVPKELKDDIKTIDSYGSFSVGLSNSGKVYVWGVGSIGATGINVADIPEEVQNAKIVAVAAGIDHIIAFDENGKFYGWGSNRFGQYAKNEEIIANPNLIPIPDEILNGEIDVNSIKKITCGYQASAVLMEDGTVYIWGNKNSYSNMDRFVDKTGLVDIDFTLNYVVGLDKKRVGIYTGTRGLYDIAKTSLNDAGDSMFAFLDGRSIESIDASTNSICMILSDGSIALTGDFLIDSVDVPQLLEGEKVVEVAAGNYHYICVTNFGNVYSFGGDHYSQSQVPKKLSSAAHVYAGSFQNYAVDENNSLIKAWGLKGFLFGTDDAGADIAERVIAGGRVTMTFGAIAVIIEIILGVSIGCISGYFGGIVDILLMRVAEVFSSIPTLPFFLIMSSLLAQVSMSGNSKLLLMMVILGILGWPGFAAITRAQILVARESEYVVAAQAMGVKGSRIAFKHILPNVISVILVNMTLSFAASMQTETTLSFLGFGVTYPQPSWGNMLTRASNATAAINFWWQWVFTSVILIITTICINTIGDTLRDVMDPKSSNDK